MNLAAMKFAPLFALAAASGALSATGTRQADAGHRQVTVAPLIDASDISRHAGQRVTICGKVKSVADRLGGVQVLTLSGSVTRPTAYLLVPVSASTPVEYLRKAVCGAGIAQVTRQGPTVIAASPDDVRVDAFASGAFEADDPDVTPPKLLRERKPQYTARALHDRIAGTVVLQAIVLPTGGVGEVRVVRSLDRDLDREAIAATKEWQFVPGRCRGEAVPVIVSIEMAFTLAK